MKALLIYLVTLVHSPVQQPIVNEPLPDFPKEDFRSPLDIPVTLAGNFGEPRRLHFHTGLDMRTNQQEGLNIYSVADGYVSRINISGSGYGKAVYITHTNGYVSVYAHLQKLVGRFAERLEKEQYARESFAVDFNLQPDELPLKQGEVFALSGNTGGSAGPHLHFEVRDSLERPINPMLFGYNFTDNLKPLISFLKFYPQDDKKLYSDGYRVRAIGANGNYQLGANVVKVNADAVSISVNAWDAMNGTGNSMGVYGMRVLVDSAKNFEFNMNRIAFSDKRYVLSHVDYPIFMNEGRRSFHKCFVEPANQCPIYNDVTNSGIIDLSDGKERHVVIEVYDFAGNTSTVKFRLVKDDASAVFQKKKVNHSLVFYPFQRNRWATDEVSFTVMEKTIFDTLLFRYNYLQTAEPAFYSAIHQLDKVTSMLFDFASLFIKTTKELPKGKEDKAVLVWKNEHGGWVSKGGKFDGAFVGGKVREFGDYAVKIDTTPPRITPVNIVPGRNMRAYRNIVFTIGDNLSGLADFDTYIDDKWVITEYDAKSARLTHQLDMKLPAGTHTFKVVAVDERNNKSEYSVKFVM